MAVNRRDFLRHGALLAGAAWWPFVAHAHSNAGPVAKPVLIGDWPLTLHTGRQTSLRALLRGKVTVVQWMFTSCSSVCPIQGAMFAALQAALEKRHEPSSGLPPWQLLSLSIDPLGDSPKALQDWLERFRGPQAMQRAQSAPRWLAAVPGINQVDDARRDIDGEPIRKASTADPHTTQVHCFDTAARVRWRSLDFAPVDAVADTVAKLQRLGGA